MPRSQNSSADSRRNFDLGLNSTDNPLLRRKTERPSLASFTSVTDTKHQRRVLARSGSPGQSPASGTTDASNAIVNSIHRRVSRRLDVALKKVDVALKQIPASFSGSSGTVLFQRSAASSFSLL